MSNHRKHMIRHYSCGYILVEFTTQEYLQETYGKIPLLWLYILLEFTTHGYFRKPYSHTTHVVIKWWNAQSMSILGNHVHTSLLWLYILGIYNPQVFLGNHVHTPLLWFCWWNTQPMSNRRKHMTSHYSCGYILAELTTHDRQIYEQNSKIKTFFKNKSFAKYHP